MLSEQQSTNKSNYDFIFGVYGYIELYTDVTSKLNIYVCFANKHADLLHVNVIDSFEHKT